MPTRDFDRRKTPQDRPFIWAGDDVRRLAGELWHECPTHCFDCLRRGPVTFAGKPAALRFAFDFFSTHPVYSQFNGTQILTWDADSEIWATEEIEITCPGASGSTTWAFVMHAPELPITDSSLDPGGLRLYLVQLEDPQGDCPDALFNLYWTNRYRADLLCTNVFVPAAGLTELQDGRGRVAAYDLSQYCHLCVEPVARRQAIPGSGDWCPSDPYAGTIGELQSWTEYEVRGLSGGAGCCSGPWEYPWGTSSNLILVEARDGPGGECLGSLAVGVAAGVNVLVTGDTVVDGCNGGGSSPPSTLRFGASCDGFLIGGAMCIVFNCTNDEVTFQNYRIVVSVAIGNSLLTDHDCALYVSDWMNYQELQDALDNGFSAPNQLFAGGDFGCFDSAPASIDIVPF